MTSLCADREAVDLSVEGVSHSFGKVEVLKDISLKVEKGEIFVIMGPSGSGKSVLLKTIAGLIQPTSGRVLLGGFDNAEKENREKVAIALVFQAGGLFNSLSVYDNLAFYPREHRLCNERTIREKVHFALKILSLEKAVNKKPAELSGGMKKRVAIARALVMEPQIVLYDEPTSELDPIMASTIAEIIATVRNELDVTTLIVSHDRDLAASIPDRVAVMMDGELIALEKRDRLFELEDPKIRGFLNPEINIEKPRFRGVGLLSES
ncbi:MAG: ABC transporter ATP-binding protein [Puniceicoccaceae bacterium]